jgi:hypothetical protein
MMMKQLIHKAKVMFFEPDGVSGTAEQRAFTALDADDLGQPVTGQQMSAEQQRIQFLETQNQQLRADIALLKNSSMGFAHELRELLADVTQLGFSTGVRTSQGVAPQAEIH